MKRIAAVLLTLAAHATGAYVYYYSDTFATIDGTKWYGNGAVSIASGGGISSATTGSLISRLAIPDGTNEYEAYARLRLSQPGGKYVLYLRASLDSMLGPTSQGTFYAFELADPVFNSQGVCSATLNLYRRASGSLALLWSMNVPCRTDTVMRAVSRSNAMYVYVNNFFVSWSPDNTIVSGFPGVGVQNTPAANAVSVAQFGQADRTPPSAVLRTQVGTALFPNTVFLQWAPPADDANGSGVVRYDVLRDGVVKGGVHPATFEDPFVSTGTTYNYTLYAIDAHGNYSAPLTFAVTTPAPQAIDPVRTGIRPTGSYYGALGEAIDVRSGNVNFSLPMLGAMSRGWQFPVALSYNSQLWRSDPGGVWKLGVDSGHGFGVQLQAGSLRPYFIGQWSVGMYKFTDASGAEYRLFQTTSGSNLWYDNDSLFVTYDAAQQRLYFNNGSYWQMGCISGGEEKDAGTYYPTLIQDSNGNQVRLTYNTGLGSPVGDSSSRFASIEDVRATQQGSVLKSFSFTYTDFISAGVNYGPHLNTVTDHLGSGQSYTFAYEAVPSLASPFGGVTSYGTATYLQSVTQTGTNLAHSFQYGAGGELTKVTYPYGGYFRYEYEPFTYLGSRTVREVRRRFVKPSASATEATFTVNRDVGDSNRWVRSMTAIVDPSGTGQKVWRFFQDTSACADGAIAGLQAGYEEHIIPTVVLNRTQRWCSSPGVGHPFVWRSDTILDGVQSGRETDLDEYGNVTQVRLYDWGTPAQVKKTYAYTYLTDANYTSRYIRNRLVSATVSEGGVTKTLVTNAFDQSALTNRTGLREHDSSGYGTSFAYRGNITSTTAEPFSGTTQYDITGFPTGGTSLGVTSAWTPEANRNNTLASTGTFNGLPAAVFASTTFLAPSTITGVNTETANVNYDAYGRVANSTSSTGALTAWTYPYPTVRQSVNLRWSQTTSDGIGRLRLTERGTASTVVSALDTEYQYCGAAPTGIVLRTSRPYAPGATKAWTTRSCPSIVSGVRTSTITAPGGAATKTTQVGNVVTVTEPGSPAVWRRTTYDVSGNVKSVEVPKPGGGTYLTSYTYNPLGQVTSITSTRDGATQTRTFTHDAKNRIETVTTPEAGTVTYAYDNATNNLIRRTDAKQTGGIAQKVEYGYDTLHRLTTLNRFMPGSTVADACQSVTFTYGASASDTKVPGAVDYPYQRMTMAAWGSSNPSVCPAGRIEERYAYTTAGQVHVKRVNVSKSIAGYGTPMGTQDAFYYYNNEGQLTDEYTNPTNINFRYDYDALARLGLVRRFIDTGPGQRQYWNLADTVSFNAADQLLTMNYLGFSESRGYNSRSQLTSIAGSGAGLPSLNLTYNFPTASNNRGQIASMQDGTETVTYTYDNMRQLKTATAGSTWSQNYSYDGFGNLHTRTGSGIPFALTINSATNRFSNFAYDANGNVTNDGTRVYTYDAENRMLTNGVGNTYSYAPDNKRIFDGSMYTFWTPDGRRLGRFRLATTPVLQGGTWVLPFTPVEMRAHFGKRLIGTAPESAPTAFVPVVTDRLGSVRIRGTQTLNYYPYGEERVVTANGVDKFATYLRDANGLDYADQRYFTSQYARFVTPDPALVGSNRYAYVGGDPVNNFDPMGLASCVPDGIGGFFCLGDGQLTGPGGGPLFRDSVTVTDRDPITGLYYGEVFRGSPGGPNAPGQPSGGDLQAERERGNVGVCMTPQGITCEEAERQRNAQEPDVEIYSPLVGAVASGTETADPVVTALVAITAGFAGGGGLVGVTGTAAGISVSAVTGLPSTVSPSLIVGSTPVLGGLKFTERYADRFGYSRYFTSGPYTFLQNEQWLEGQISTGQSFLVGPGRFYTQIEREILLRRGYTRIGEDAVHFLSPRVP